MHRLTGSISIVNYAITGPTYYEQKLKSGTFNNPRTLPAK